MRQLIILFFFLISISFPQTKVLDHINNSGGRIIGYNYYDYLSSGTTGEKLIQFPDGTMLFFSMAAVDTNWRTRGSYYNYFDGNSWLDTSTIWHRIEKNRRGWTQASAYSDKKAFVVSHTGLELNVNTGTPQSPVWKSSIIPNTLELSWPKIAADDGGGQYQDLYLIAGTAVPNAGSFLRSTDAGETWESIKYLIDTTSSDWQKGYIRFTVDNIAIAARNEKVAILSFTAYGNVTLFYSEDRGNSFSTKTLYRAVDLEEVHNYVKFDSTLALEGFIMTGIGVPDGTGDVHIDMQGRIHCAWANHEVGYVTLADTNKNPIRDSLGRLQPKFFVTDWSGVGISYWNSEIDTITKAALPIFDTYLVELDNLGIPKIKNNPHNRALIGRPSMGSDKYGSMHMVFEGFRGETGIVDGIEYPYNHIYITASHGGLQWSGTQEIFEFFSTSFLDMSYPVLPDYIHDEVNICYQIDDIPGMSVHFPNEPRNKNYLVHTVFQHIVNDAESVTKVPEKFYVSDPYPNPFNPSTIINYEMPSEGRVQISLFNSLGEVVRSVLDEIQPGGRHRIKLDLEGISAGVYYCRVNYFSNRDAKIRIKKLLYLK